MRIGLIADTHGYVDARAVAALRGVDAILHAGDVGGARVLEALAAIAPLHAVYGNNDEKLGGLGLPFRLDVTLGGIAIHVVHQRPHAQPPPGTRVVVFGHSHRMLAEEAGGMLWVNPGAAGRAGFHRTQSVALLHIRRGRAEVEFVDLGPREPAPRRRRPSAS